MCDAEHITLWCVDMENRDTNTISLCASKAQQGYLYLPSKTWRSSCLILMWSLDDVHQDLSEANEQLISKVIIFLNVTISTPLLNCNDSDCSCILDLDAKNSGFRPSQANVMPDFFVGPNTDETTSIPGWLALTQPIFRSNALVQLTN